MDGPHPAQRLRIKVIPIIHTQARHLYLSQRMLCDSLKVKVQRAQTETTPLSTTPQQQQQQQQLKTNNMPRILANLDMYRKVPLDLLEGSKQGNIISWMALMLMMYLIFFETKDFVSSKLQTDLALDQSKDKRLRVNFNVTMMDIRCEYAAIDVVSFLGKQQNVTKNVQKWAVDGNGVQQDFVRQNPLLQADIRLGDEKVTQTIEELHDNGEHAIALDATTFKFAMEEHEFVFVDFFASW